MVIFGNKLLMITGIQIVTCTGDNKRFLLTSIKKRHLSKQKTQLFLDVDSLVTINRRTNNKHTESHFYKGSSQQTE